MIPIENRHAYFLKLIRNSTINDHRANDNFYKYISPVGDELHEKVDAGASARESAASIEAALSEESPQNWLLFLEDNRLQRGLASLPEEDLHLLFRMFSDRLTQREIAEERGISQAAVCKRYQRILKKLKEFF